jgi:hypothetical protein
METFPFSSRRWVPHPEQNGLVPGTWMFRSDPVSSTCTERRSRPWPKMAELSFGQEVAEKMQQLS